MIDQIITDKTAQEMFEISGSYSRGLMVIDPIIVDSNIKKLQRYSFEEFGMKFHEGISIRLQKLGVTNMFSPSLRDMPPIFAFFIDDVVAERIFQMTNTELRMHREAGRLYFRFHKGKVIYPLKQIMELSS